MRRYRQKIYKKGSKESPFFSPRNYEKQTTKKNTKINKKEIKENAIEKKQKIATKIPLNGQQKYKKREKTKKTIKKRKNR